MSNKTTIGFSGDVSFSAFFKDVYKKEDLLSPEIHKFFEGNDANIINQESPITECRITRKKRLSHRTDVDVIPKFYQKTIPNVIVSLANNHMLDYGRIGVIDSCENLEKYNCPYIGIGRNRLEASRYIIVGEDVKVGVIAIEYKRFKPHGGKWAAPFYEGNMGALANRITTMKQDEKVDWVVVVYHGGEEFLNFPLPFNKKLVHRIADLGADAVVAHHPHVVQGYEYYKGKPIFYSLGNFIFDTTYQRAQEGTTEGMLVKLNFTKDEITWDNLPIHIDREAKTVSAGEVNPYFIDINSVNYNANWTYQCVRKKEVLERAKELRVREKNEIAMLSENEAARIEQIKMKYILQEADDELNGEPDSLNDAGDIDAVVEDGSGESLATDTEKKYGRAYFKKIIKKGIKKITRSKNRTYFRGRLLYKTFYRGKELKA